MQRATPNKGITKEIKARVTAPKKKKPEFDGNTEVMVSTGSTLLDLAISGGRVRGGGIPGGILVEIFGPSSSGKTVLLCEIAGSVYRAGGEVMFQDPEARLNELFASIFDLDTKKIALSTPDTISEVFSAVRDWEPKGKEINGIFTDSLAALSTEVEMDDEDEGDKSMGMRRAKEFSEQLRVTCRILAHTNLIMVVSNQIRDNVKATQYGPKSHSPGGRAIGFYASLRLKTAGSMDLKRKVKRHGKVVTEIHGIETEIKVEKSSIWKPSKTAKVTIDFDYGIDDIRENLKYLKTTNNTTVYKLGEEKIEGKGIEDAIAYIEKEGLEDQLREEVIDTWEEYQKEFHVERKPKKR